MTELITILGPTASGKTALAAQVASAIGAEVISADSRQVFSEMNIGTGKDLDDFIIGNMKIPYHLIDVAEPGTEFSVFNFVTGFRKAFSEIRQRGNVALLCGGTGLYIEAVLKGYEMVEVPVNQELRKEWETLSDATLTEMLLSFKQLHNTTDTETRERLLRALEIEFYRKENQPVMAEPDFKNSPVFGLKFDRLLERERITQRLKMRLENGMIDEVKQLLDKGISPARLVQYGLEYRYVTRYISGEISYDDMFRLLNTAIHQFAKRQMTWFRRMERTGITIHWLRGEDGMKKNKETILQCIE
ncbi:MAG TPA: tRNA (adenosine(37)-N6)-dimethylallyltransferase MiaA [Bacteroidales bacterium]|nr:tRNA (adenosine(37)-N6)-dimethylallyltransferase MiaA [Bacteroidales bacterium]